MASAYGIARTYNEFIPPVNLEVMANVMQEKQSRYDQAYQRLQQQYAMYQSIDLLKEEDKQYFVERGNSLVNEINNLPRGLDLSDKAVEASISRHLGQVLDDNVINAVGSTQRYRAFQEQVQKLKEKNPEQYSVVNELYAMRDFQSWYNDEKAGTVLKDMQYTPYVDVNKKMTEIVKDAFKMFGVTQDISLKGWQKTIAEYQGVEGEKIRNMVNAQLSSQDIKQLEIDGWYKYGLADTETAQAKLSEYVIAAKKEAEGHIENLKKNRTVENKAQVDEDIELWNSQLARLEKAKTNLKTPEQIGTYFETENIIRELQDAYGKQLKSLDVEVNPVYEKQMDTIMWEKEMELEYAKLSMKQKKLQDEQDAQDNVKTAPSGDADTKQDGGTVWSNTGGAIIEAQKDFFNNVGQKIGEDGAALQKEVLDLAKKEGISTRQAVEKVMTKKGKTLDIQDKANLEALAARKVKYTKALKDIVDSDLATAETSLRNYGAPNPTLYEAKAAQLIREYKKGIEDGGEYAEQYSALLKSLYVSDEFKNLPQNTQRVLKETKAGGSVMGTKSKETIEKEKREAGVKAREEGILGFKQPDVPSTREALISNKYNTRLAREDQFKAIALNMKEEYGKRDFLLDPTKNKIYYDNALLLSSSGLNTTTPFKKDVTIRIERMDDGSFKASQEYVEGTGENAVTKNPSFVIPQDEMQGILPDNTLYSMQVDFKFFEGYARQITTPYSPEAISPEFKKEALQSNNSTVKALLNTPQNFKVVTTNDGGLYNIKLLELNGTEVYSLNYKNIDDASISLREVISYPELLVRAAIKNIITNEQQ